MVRQRQVTDFEPCQNSNERKALALARNENERKYCEIHYISFIQYNICLFVFFFTNLTTNSNETFEQLVLLWICLARGRRSNSDQATISFHSIDLIFMNETQINKSSRIIQTKNKTQKEHTTWENTPYIDGHSIQKNIAMPVLWKFSCTDREPEHKNKKKLAIRSLIGAQKTRNRFENIKTLQYDTR